MIRADERVRRGRPHGRWTTGDLAEVVEAVLRARPDRAWSAEDLRERLAFGREGGPALSSVREALRALTDAGRVERVDVWGLQGWGNTAHAFRAARGPGQLRLGVAA
jgi:Fe2+ or Zn2+ uptake regulation protein